MYCKKRVELIPEFVPLQNGLCEQSKSLQKQIRPPRHPGKGSSKMITTTTTATMPSLRILPRPHSTATEQTSATTTIHLDATRSPPPILTLQPTQQKPSKKRSAIPWIHLLPHLRDSKDGLAAQSCPNNRWCNLQNEYCSQTMRCPNLCFWHAMRMAEPVSLSCQCAIGWEGWKGDAVGRRLRLQYQPDSRSQIPIWDPEHGIFCCIPAITAYLKQEASTYQLVGTCGNMKICAHCSVYHKNGLPIFQENSKEEEPDMKTMVEENLQEELDGCEYEGKGFRALSPPATSSAPHWPHEQAFFQSLQARMEKEDGDLAQFQWTFGRYGPETYVQHPHADVSIYLHSSVSVLSAVALFPERQDFLIWLAGWMMDAPTSIRHF